jgi:hypothetical protein
MQTEWELEEPLTNDERLLLRYQKARIEYYEATFSGNKDWEYQLKADHEYFQAQLALLDDLEDPTLKQLARDACGPSLRRQEEASEELLALSRRIKDLFPEKHISTRKH